MRETDGALRLAITLALSLGGHLGAFVVLLLLPAFSLFPEPDPVEITVLEEPPPPEPELEEPPPPEPEPPPPEPEPEPVVHRVRPPTPQPTRPQPPPAEPPPPEPQPAPAPEPMDMTQMPALTNPTPTGAAFQAPSQAAGDGPYGSVNSHGSGTARGVTEGSPGGTGTGEPTIVPASDLSRRPGPPNERLQTLLERNYPREARNLGVEGHADVRVHVRADGSVQPLAVVSESYEGFGNACRATIRAGGRWSPPLDRQGREVDTRLVFRCTFTIRF